MNGKQRLRLVKGKNEKSSIADDGSWQADDTDNDYHKEITALYQDYNETLVRYLTIRLRSRQDAVEVAQEAYIRLIRRENLKDIACFQSFLFRTATNISIDLQRQRARQAKNFASSKFLLGDIDEITPERTLNARQKISALKEVLEDLPPKCREAFMLYKFKNLGHMEIAEKMGLSVSSVRKYIARGLAFCIHEMNK
jgi:RNA polymerase sigma-70 factor (ECF subfamily)